MITINVTLKTLEALQQDYTHSTLAQFILNELEVYGNDWYSELEYTLNKDCEVIYHRDLEAFHDEHEEDIDKIIKGYLDMTNLSFEELAKDVKLWDIQDLKVWKAFFSYKYMCEHIKEEIESGTYEDVENE